MLRVEAPPLIFKWNRDYSLLPGGPRVFFLSAFVSLCVLAIFCDMPLKYLWGIINQVQLIEFLLLICVNKPYPLKLVFRALSFVNGDFMLIRLISSLYSSRIPSELLR